MSPEIQSDSSNPVPSNRPLRDLIDARNREKYLKIGLPLYEASIKCDWKAAEAILDKNKEMPLVRCSITENGETALHIAASAKAPKKKVDEFVRNLVQRMTPDDLKLVNNNQSTALFLAAVAGNIETVTYILNKNGILFMIPGGGGDMMPLYAAVLFGNKDVAEYIYECSRKNLDLDDGWTCENRRSLLEKCVESDMFASAYFERNGQYEWQMDVLYDWMPPRYICDMFLICRSPFAEGIEEFLRSTTSCGGNLYVVWSVFVGIVDIHDRYTDMQPDIDNMSYEESKIVM